VLSGNIGDAAIANPRLLLGVDVTSDEHRIGATHYEWDARVLSLPTDPAAPEPCTEMVYPYDEAASTAFASSHDSYDGCIVRGFAFSSSVQSWRGEPGAAPPSTANVETRTEVRTIDDFGRVLEAARLNDLHRADDDLCVVTAYAAPTGTNERQLYAPSSRAITSCEPASSGGVTYASGRWEYDDLPVGSVTAGFPTSYTVERRDDTGALLDTIRTFDTSYDALGNPASVTTTREDGASRTATTTYDPFGLMPIGTTITATDLPALQTTIAIDPVTLHVLSVTDPNGTQHAATFDGFDREILSTIRPPSSALGALSITTYHGFTGSDPAGRRIAQKVFTDPVDPATAATAPGRSSTVYLDELGRSRHAELALGADYQNQLLVVGRRTYDGLGRVVFEADPHPSNQSFASAYGTTQFFHADGAPSCSVRGNGQQGAVPTATNESQELYPTCIQRAFQDHTLVVSVRDAASLLSNSPQAEVIKSSYTTRSAGCWAARRGRAARASSMQHSATTGSGI
jgi:hypothetical protein